MRTGLLVSAFDIVDVADLDVLRQAREECDRLAAGVLTDEIIEPLTGVAPIVPERDRLEIVRALRGVAEAELFNPGGGWEPEPDSVVMFGRLDHFTPILPVERWLRPRRSDHRATSHGARDGQLEPHPGQRVGYVPGAWDMFHVGHLNLLRRARAECEYLVVGVVTDETLVAAKGRPPEIPLAERLKVVDALSLVDAVVVDRSTSKLDAWRRVHFDVLFKGTDWQGTSKGQRLEADMARVGASVRYFPYTEHVSSTALREIRSRRAHAATTEAP